jgi:nucleoside 2-deoxyribosyltransferase
MRYKSIYTAGPFAWQSKLSAYAEELRLKGLRVNSRWLLEKVSAVAKNVEIPVDYARKTAVLDIEDILASEALLLFTVGAENFPEFSIDALARGGRHFEAGLAYALGKKVIVCGPFKENVFHSLKDITYYETWEGAKKYLLSRSVLRRKPLESRVFGRRKIVNAFGPNASICECACGRIDVVENISLQRGEADSCGCAASNPTAAKDRILSIYKYAARKRSLSWELSEADFYKLVEQTCHFCGAAPSNRHVVRRKEWTNEFVYGGIDRLNNEIGYTVSNSVPCCKTCNLAKGTMSAEEFIRWVHRIASHQGSE